MKHKLNMMAAALPLLLGANIAHADVDLFGGKVKAGGYLAQHWQSAIEVSGANRQNAADARQNSGFQRLRVGLWFSAQISDRVGAFIEIADEPNDYGAGEQFSFAMNQDLAWIDLKLTDNDILRVGNVVETTMNFLRYSDGASVQGNPNIGNGLADMITATHGIWLTGAHDASFGKWDYNLTLTIPSFADAFYDESGYNYGARTSMTTNSGFGIGAGVFIFDGDVVGCATPTTCKLGNGAAQRSLMTVGDGDNYRVGQNGQGTRAQVAGILPGIDGHVWQIDLMWSGDAVGVPLTVQAFYGEGEDEYSHSTGSMASNGGGDFSTVDAEQSFWGIFGKYAINDKFYVSSRYQVSTNDTAGVGGENEVDRLQLTGGFWISDSTLLKAEYVKQNEDAQSGGGMCNPAGASSCDWDGFVMELSVSF